MATKLTAAFVRLVTTTEPPQATTLFDTELRRFYLEVKPPAKPWQPNDLLRHRLPTMTSRYIHLADRHQSHFQDHATAYLDPEPTGEIVTLPKRG
jgi:hypothetical protein